MFAFSGFIFYLTAGCLVIHTWKDINTPVYQGKGLGLGSMMIIQAFIMLAESGLQILNIKSQ